MEKQKRTLRRRIKIIGLTLVCACVCALLLRHVIWFLDIGSVRHRAYVRGHRITRTWNVFHSIGLAISLATNNSGEQPPEDIDAIIGFLKEHVEAYRDHADGYEPWLDPETNAIVDAWENRVRLVVESPHNYRFISAGPNGRYEDGKADDIVYEFDPWKLAEAGERETTEDQ